MGLFTKSEVIILKDNNSAQDYLNKLEQLLPKLSGKNAEDVQREIAITKAGIYGEEQILFELKNSGMNMVVLHDVYIETNDGRNAQIDFIVVTPKLIYLIECKNLFGNLEIDSKGNFIRTIEYAGKKQKEGIYSPLTQNERHLSVLKDCKLEDQNIIMRGAINGTFSSFHRSLVVLANPKTVVYDRYAPKEIKEQIIRADQLIAVMKRMEAESKILSSTKKEILEIGQKLLNRNIEHKKDYWKKYTELEQQLQKMERICPKCGNKLVLRIAKKGTNARKSFYGCAGFPNCRYTE